MDTNNIESGKRDEIIKKQKHFIENNYVNRKLENKGGVIFLCHERLWSC